MSEEPHNTPSRPSVIDAPAQDWVDQLADKASIGAIWTVLGFGGRQIIRLISNLILVRLLLREDFGVMDLVTVLLVGLRLFSDIGIGPAIIQNKRDDSKFVDTVFSIQVVRGWVLWGIACAIAPHYARFFEEPLLKELIIIGSFVAVIEGFLPTKFFTQNRQLKMKRLIAVEIIAQVIGVGVMIIWAILSPTVWSLVAGTIVTEVVLVLLSYVWLEGRLNRFRIDFQAAKDFFHFGVWIFFSTALLFCVDYFDRMMFGKLITKAELGVYGRALMLAQVPAQALAQLSHKIIFPLYSRVFESDGDLPLLYRQARKPVLVIGGWCSAGLIAGGPTIVALLFPDSYVDAGWILQLIAAGIWFGVIMQETHIAGVLAVGQSQWAFASGLGKLVGMALCLSLGWQFAGFAGAVVGLALSELFRYAVALYGAKRFGMDGFRQDAELSTRVALSAIVAWGCVELAKYLAIDFVLVHALIIFIVVSALWWRLLWPIIDAYRKGESVFA